MSHKVKTVTQSNLVSWCNITREIFFFRNDEENVTGIPVPDLFLFF